MASNTAAARTGEAVSTRNRYRPDLSSHPGDTLREMLRERQVTQKDFAAELGIKDSYLSDVILVDAAKRLGWKRNQASYHASRGTDGVKRIGYAYETK